ncbi:hypothetical protein [Rickettsia asembonensis]|uniref:hypothetical protein n=1 Tax=Rickettsia asembonensis TaxID=1068590 RepID=UPI000B04FCB9|nr:hypothetical protein [Rickettsia asembonensis]
MHGYHLVIASGRRPHGNPVKIIKKMLKISIFNWIASSKLTVFPRNDEKNYPCNNANASLE